MQDYKNSLVNNTYFGAIYYDFSPRYEIRIHYKCSNKLPQDTSHQATALDYGGNSRWYYTCLKKYHQSIFLKIRDATHLYLYSVKTKYYLCVSERRHKVVQLNPNEDKYYLLTPFTTLMTPLNKFFPESTCEIARNPPTDLQ